jgi:hypothetical protein
MNLEEKIELKPLINGDPNFKADLVLNVDNKKIVSVNSKGVITVRNPVTTYLTVTVKNTLNNLDSSDFIIF